MSRTPNRGTTALLGLVYIGFAALMVAVTMASYNKVFADNIEVTLEAGDIGNALRDGSDVKVRGVPVGNVINIENVGSESRLTLQIAADKAQWIPNDSTARLLPKTLFGERFVSLVADAGSSTVPISNGDTIVQDASSEAIEMEKLLDSLLPVLKTVQPEKLSAMLTEMADALEGQGDTIGAVMERWQAYLGKLNPRVDEMADGFKLLGEVSRDYAAATPDFLDALDNLQATAETLTDKRAEVQNLLETVTTSSNTTGNWVSSNSDTIISLSVESRAFLQMLARYSPEFPCLSQAMVDHIPVMDKALGKGTSERGIHAEVSIVPSRGKYTSKDTISYSSGAGPSCPGSGQANSPAENRLIAELLSSGSEMSPEDYPNWSSLVVGPALRGTNVSVKPGTPGNSGEAR